MNLCYAPLLDVYKEIEEEMEKEGNQFRVHYAKEVVGHLLLWIPTFFIDDILYGLIYT